MYTYADAILNFEESILKGKCPSWEALYSLLDRDEWLPPEIDDAVRKMVPDDLDPNIRRLQLKYRNAVPLLIDLKTGLEGPFGTSMGPSDPEMVFKLFNLKRPE